MQDHVYYPAAKEMARNGASRGMIVQMLRKEHLDEASANAVADCAVQSERVRQRWFGAATAVLGLAVMLGAAASASVFAPRLPLTIGMAGLMLSCAGLFHVVGPSRPTIKTKR